MTHQVERNLNNTASVQILGERGPFHKSTVKVGLTQPFRNQNLHIGHAGPDIYSAIRALLTYLRWSIFIPLYALVSFYMILCVK